MKKITYIIAGLFLLIGSIGANAQMEMNEQDCIIEYNLYKGDLQGNFFDTAKTRLTNLMTNCPKLSVNIYKLGTKIVDDMIAKGDKDNGVALFNKIYSQRVKNYTKGLGKVYSDWADFIAKNGGTEAEVISLLEKGYKADPTGLSAKNIYKYFDVVLENNKNSNVQKILDTHDDINDALVVKSGKYQQRLSKLLAKEEGGVILESKEAKSKIIAEAVLKNIGIISGGLDQKIEELLTCDRLVPLYRRYFESNRLNGQWLRRSVSRMFKKGCTGDALYEELVEAYANAEPSAESKIFYARLLEKRGKLAEATAMRKEAFHLETDPTKKSNLLLKDAQDLSRKGKGKRNEARRQANEALKFNPSNGNAYLLIATIYAKSANGCGTTLFSKRMVYVAALNKARRATVVDPSMASKVRKFTRAYASYIPTIQDAFTEGYKSGDSYKIGCWIGETVRVQVR